MINDDYLLTFTSIKQSQFKPPKITQLAKDSPWISGEHSTAAARFPLSTLVFTSYLSSN